MNAFFLLLLFVGPMLSAYGDDWPTRLHDVYRSGVTRERIYPPLTQAWVCTTERGPRPAWTESPAVHDYLHNWYDLKPRQNFDRCFDVAVVGERVFFGSSTSGAVTCLDTANGEEVWTYFTDGPVRFAPHVDKEKVYVGSDDGFVYCLNARDGKVVWSERAGPSDAKLWGNEHMISVWPVRTSVLVDGADVFWTAGIFPEEGMFVCKRDAATGTGGWTKEASAPPQGYLLALPDRVFVPTGKAYPRIYSRESGDYAGDIKGNSRDGGCWALISPERNEFWFGPNVENDTQGFNASSRAKIAMVADANCLIATEQFLYHTTDSQLIKTNRVTQSAEWSVASAYPHALILAGDLLFAGGDNEVAAFSTSGERTWTSPVDGKVYGLAAANGALYVSTDQGSIYCFRAELPAVRNTDEVRIAAASATLTGILASNGASSASVDVFWGPTDGGVQAGQWRFQKALGKRSPGPLAVTIDGLAPDQHYYFRFRATNAEGEAWAPDWSSFSTARVTVRVFRDRIEEAGRRHGGFTISRSGNAAPEPLEVHFRIGGTATPGVDYEAVPETAVIPAGEADVSIPIAAIDDLVLNEEDERVSLTLERARYLLGEEREAAVTIAPHRDLKAWGHRMGITFSGYGREEALDGFPVLICLNKRLEGFSYGQFGAPGGGDLRFTDADGTRLLSYQIESWDPEGDSYVWVQLPELKGIDTSIRAYWGNPQARAPGKAGDEAVWATGFDGVWHFAERGGEVIDSAPKGNNGVPSGGLGQGWGGRVGLCARFDGKDDLAVLTKTLDTGASDGTVSVWAKVPRTGTGGLDAGTRVGIILGNCPSVPMSNWEIHADGRMRTYWDGGKIDVRAVTDLRDDAWHHLAWVRDKAAGVSLMYIDGRLDKKIAGAGADILFSSMHSIGADNRSAKGPVFHGLLDELRVVSAARSADWLWACWKNQIAPKDFAEYGAVERE